MPELVDVTPGWWSAELFGRFVDGGDDSPEVQAFGARWRALTAALNRRAGAEGFTRVVTERGRVCVEVPRAGADDARRNRLRTLAEATA